ncbi:hypothetical protein MTR67_019030 [Solanum verrucosum]|uniref:Uncharacterized protein n=1 Tax=Solanum verrucosum TaxID=315347 RepID=A0AAF0TTJ2_SOLVR|nr:hypothetical protein MTR67_019030 [Solanum verrucosum]
MPRTTKDVLYSWEEIGRRGSGEDWWELIPACIWWTLWKERNARCFEDKRNNTQEIRMNCLSLLYFWCKQNMVGNIELFVDFIGNL